MEVPPVGATFVANGHHDPPQGSTELTVKPGDKVYVIANNGSGWLRGRIDNRIGFFPFAHVFRQVPPRNLGQGGSTGEVTSASPSSNSHSPQKAVHIVASSNPQYCPPGVELRLPLHQQQPGQPPVQYHDGGQRASQASSQHCQSPPGPSVQQSVMHLQHETITPGPVPNYQSPPGQTVQQSVMHLQHETTTPGPIPHYQPPPGPPVQQSVMHLQHETTAPGPAPHYQRPHGPPVQQSVMHLQHETTTSGPAPHYQSPPHSSAQYSAMHLQQETVMSEQLQQPHRMNEDQLGQQTTQEIQQNPNEGAVWRRDDHARDYHGYHGAPLNMLPEGPGQTDPVMHANYGGLHFAEQSRQPEPLPQLPGHNPPRMQVQGGTAFGQLPSQEKSGPLPGGPIAVRMPSFGQPQQPQAQSSAMAGWLFVLENLRQEQTQLLSLMTSAHDNPPFLQYLVGRLNSISMQQQEVHQQMMSVQPPQHVQIPVRDANVLSPTSESSDAQSPQSLSHSPSATAGVMPAFSPGGITPIPTHSTQVAMQEALSEQSAALGAGVNTFLSGTADAEQRNKGTGAEKLALHEERSRGQHPDSTVGLGGTGNLQNLPTATANQPGTTGNNWPLSQSSARPDSTVPPQHSTQSKLAANFVRVDVKNKDSERRKMNPVTPGLAGELDSKTRQDDADEEKEMEMYEADQHTPTSVDQTELDLSNTGAKKKRKMVVSNVSSLNESSRDLSGTGHDMLTKVTVSTGQGDVPAGVGEVEGPSELVGLAQNQQHAGQQDQKPEDGGENYQRVLQQQEQREQQEKDRLSQSEEGELLQQCQEEQGHGGADEAAVGVSASKQNDSEDSNERGVEKGNGKPLAGEEEQSLDGEVDTSVATDAEVTIAKVSATKEQEKQDGCEDRKPADSQGTPAATLDDTEQAQKMDVDKVTAVDDLGTSVDKPDTNRDDGTSVDLPKEEKTAKEGKEMDNKGSGILDKDTSVDLPKEDKTVEEKKERDSKGGQSGEKDYVEAKDNKDAEEKSAGEKTQPKKKPKQEAEPNLADPTLVRHLPAADGPQEVYIKSKEPEHYMQGKPPKRGAKGNVGRNVQAPRRGEEVDELIKAFRKDGVITVTFYALLSPKWELADDEQVFICFGTQELGLFRVTNVKMQIAKPRGDYLTLTGKFELPLPLVHPNMPYQYVVMTAGHEDCKWEYIQESKRGGIVNRCLNIPTDKKIDGGAFMKYDDVVRPPLGSFNRLRAWWNKFISSDEPVKERQNSLQAMLPKFKFPSDPTIAYPLNDFVERVTAVVNSFTEPRLLDVTRTDEVPFIWRLNGFDPHKVLKERYVSPLLEKACFKDSPLTHSQRVAFAISLCFIIKQQGLRMKATEASDLMRLLRVEGDADNQSCPSVDDLANFFPDRWTTYITDVVVWAINYSIHLNQANFPYVEWIYAMPLLHFLTKACEPYKLPRPIQRHFRDAEMDWFGLFAIDDRKLHTLPTGEDVMKMAMTIQPLIDADFLLRRILLFLCPFNALHKAMALVHPSTMLRAVRYHLLVQGKSWPEGKVEMLLQCAINLRPMCEHWLLSPLMANDQASMLSGAVREGQCLLQELSTISQIWTHSRHGVILLRSLLDGIFYHIPRHHERMEKRMDEDPSERDYCQDKMRQIANSVQDIQNTVSEIIQSYLIQGLMKKQPDAVIKELRIWNTFFCPPHLEMVKLHGEWQGNILALMTQRFDEVDDATRLELLCAIETSTFSPEIRSSLSDIQREALDRLIVRGEAGQKAFDDLSKDRRSIALISHMLVEYVGKKVSVHDRHSGEMILHHLFNWSCWPAYISHYWSPASHQGSSSQAAQLEPEAQELLTLGMSALEGMLTRLVNRLVTVEHLNMANENRTQLLVLCDAMDTSVQRLQGRDGVGKGRSYRDTCEESLDERLEEVRQSNVRKGQLTSLFSVCELANITVTGVKELREKALGNISNLTVRELLGYLSCGDDVEEMLPPFKEACMNHLFQALWKDQTKRLCQSAGSVLQIELNLDAIAQRVYRPVFDQWQRLFTSLFDSTLHLHVVDSCFKGLESLHQRTELLNCMYNSCCEAGVRSMAVQHSGWIQKRAVQIGEYQDLVRAVIAAEAVRSVVRMMDLTGDFHVVEFLCQQVTEDFKNQPLRAVTKEIVDASKFLLRLTKEQQKCLTTFGDCLELVKWLKKEVKELTELKTFVDLATIAVSESGGLEEAKITCLHTACTGYAGLIYQLPQTAGFDEFMEACEPTFHALKGDPHLPEKLRDTKVHLEWLKSVRASHESVAVSSFSQAEAINTRGVYMISVPDSAKGITPTVESCVRVFIPPAEGKKTVHDNKWYTLEGVKDLQSKLVLVAPKQETYGGLVQEFISVVDGVCRVAASLVEHCAMGNAKFLSWHRAYSCKGNCQEVIDQTNTEAEELEASFENWKDELKNCRVEHWWLNFFTIQQLIVLQRELAEISGQKAAVIPSQVFMLLSAIKMNLTAADIIHSVRTGLADYKTAESSVPSSPSTSYLRQAAGGTTMYSYQGDPVDEPMDVDGGYFDGVRQLMDLGFTMRVAKAALTARHGNVEQAMVWAKSYGSDEEKLLACELSVDASAGDGSTADHDLALAMEMSLSQSRPQTHISIEQQQASSVVHDFLSLDQIGHILACLAQRVERRAPSQLPKYVTPGQPNLVVVPEADLLGTVMDLYRFDSSWPLPTHSEVLVCTPQTTAEEVKLLWRRALFDPLSHLYCLVNADQLDYTVSTQAMVDLQDLTTDEKYRLVIVCSRENEEHAWIMSTLDRYRCVPTPCLADELRHYLRDQFTFLPAQQVTKPDGSRWQPAADVDEKKSCVRLVTSEQPGVGKSLFIRRLEEKLVKMKGNEDLLHRFQYMKDGARVRVSVPVRGTSVDVSTVLDVLLEHAPEPDKPLSRLLHFDVSPTIRHGLDAFLFNLLVLGCISDHQGRVWCRQSVDLYVIEVTCGKHAFTSLALANGYLSDIGVTRPPAPHGTTLPFYVLLPAQLCGSPAEAMVVMEKKKNLQPSDPQLELLTFHTQPFQRVFAYLQRFIYGQDSLDHFKFMAGRPIGDPRLCLPLLMKHCGVKNPSWLVLNNFVHFLNVQLKDCEQSVFCNQQLVGNELAGFRSFVIRLMMRMSKDFATPSLLIDGLTQDDDGGMEQYGLRRRWEQSPHPYLFFNHDRLSLTFVGFNVTRDGNLVDRTTNDVLEKNVMTRRLHTGLRTQKVDLNEDFLSWTRDQKLDRLCKVLGQSSAFEPDETYELTLDNVKKILAIQMRFRCGIPVVVMGETGCGKTRLIRFMCRLQAGGKDIKNMLMMKVHGGVTEEDVKQKVLEAEDVAKRNADQHQIDTVLFFDEANTSEALGIICEVMCDHRVQGRSLDPSVRLRVIAACNPYRRHSDMMIKRLEEAGLGYHIRADKTEDKLGLIPLRQLVYRVHPLPGSMLPLVWDFGQLNPDVECLYIHQIVTRYVVKELRFGDPPDLDIIDAVTDVLAAAQRYMRTQEDECSFVSLRDVERAMMVMSWFYDLNAKQLSQLIQDKEDKELQDKISGGQQQNQRFLRPEPLAPVSRALVLCLGVCYQARLREREAFRACVAKAFKDPCSLPGGADRMEVEIRRCQQVFLDQLHLGPNIAKNKALCENVFMMVVCIDLRIPLFLVGKPGSSKSLAKAVVTDAMQGDSSPSPLFRLLKQVQMVSYQCSPLSTPDGIVNTFKQCQRFQKDKNLDRFVAVVVLDEVGLAEDSPRMPLKALHPLLEDGTSGADDAQGQEDIPIRERVAFVGISNWALDPAKMNRGIMVSRGEPDEKELEMTAEDICATDPVIQGYISPLISNLAKAYRAIHEAQDKEFFGLRDFYSLIKMIYGLSAASQRPPIWQEIELAVRRNFGGLQVEKPVEEFKNRLGALHADCHNQEAISTLELIRASFRHEGSNHHHGDNRYLLVLTENCDVALEIMQGKKMDLLPENAVVIFGSSFPKDQVYTQVCRDINRIKVCMETGQTVVLLNLENLYESLYDALNQAFVNLGGHKYVDLGLGSHRVKCRVDEDFRLIVIAKRKDVQERFPIPLINRLEKHFLSRSTVLSDEQMSVAQKVEQWVKNFSRVNPTIIQCSRQRFTEGDAFVGYHGDTPAAVVLQACAELSAVQGSCVKDSGGSQWRQCVLERAKQLLIQMCPPDALARLSHTPLAPEAKLCWKIYFEEQQHSSLIECLKTEFENLPAGEDLCLQVTTHSRLLSTLDVGYVASELNMEGDGVKGMLLQQFNTQEQFLREVEKFFSAADWLYDARKLLLIQSDSGDQHGDLLACARHRLREVRDAAVKQNASTGYELHYHVVFIVQLPRIAGGCFQGAQGGLWRSIHIDELRPPALMECPPVTVLVGKSMSGLFKESVTTHPQAAVSEHEEAEEMAELYSGRQSMHVEETVSSPPALNLRQLLLSSVQGAVSRLSDHEVAYEEAAARIRTRIDLLQGLLINESGIGSFNEFTGILCERLAKLLTERDERAGHIAERWVQNEALATSGLQEGGTFQRALWLKLQTTLTPVLAEVVGVLDCSANLSLMKSDSSAWVKSLWLAVLSNSEIVPLSYESFLVQTSEESAHQLRQRVPVPAMGAGFTPFTAAFPFSWLIKKQIDALLPQAQSTAEQSGQTLVTCLRNAVDMTPLGHLLKQALHDGRSDAIRRYLHDFSAMVYRAQTTAEANLVRVCLIHAQREVQSHDPESTLDITAVHAGHHFIQNRLNCLGQLLAVRPSVVDRMGDLLDPSAIVVTGDLQCLQLVLEELLPNAKRLSSHGSQQQWLKDLASVSSAVEALLAAVVRERNQLSMDAQNLLEVCRPLWAKLNAVRLFVQHITLPCKDEFLNYASSHLFTVLGSDADFRTRATMEKVIEFLQSCTTGRGRLSVRVCPSCRLTITNPTVFPCQHVMCLDCAQQEYTRTARCPVCNWKVPGNFKLIPNKSFSTTMKNVPKFKEHCNAFFMELVSSCCFGNPTVSGGLGQTASQGPATELVELLLQLVSGNKGQGTRSLSPFSADDYIDRTPVVRSFLLQLLLRFSQDQVDEHIRQYLEQAQMLASGHRVYNDELCQLFVQCVEDQLHCHLARLKDVRGAAQGVRMAREALERAQEVMRRLVWVEQPAANVSLLYSVAGARFGLTIAAQHICTELQVKTSGAEDGLHSAEISAQERALQKAIEYLKVAAKEICEQCPEAMLKIFLMKQIVRTVGLDLFRRVVDKPVYKLQWVMPRELAENAQEVVPDRFIIHEQPYRGIREAMAGTVLSAELGNLEKATRSNQRNRRMVSTVTALAVYREVTMCSADRSSDGHVKRASLAKLNDFVATPGRFPDDVRGFVSDLVHNRQGAGCNRLRVCPGQDGSTRSLSALVMHYASVLMHSVQHNRLLEFLSQLAFNPAILDKSFFPTMPEDFLQDARQVLGGAWYECPNGHPYFIGECGQPMQSYTCPDCGAHIGGGHHKIFDSNKRARTTDTSQTGHVLGQSSQRNRTPVPERDLGPAPVALLRLFVDVSLLWASSGDEQKRQAVVEVTHPPVPSSQISNYYWSQIEHDVQVFSSAIGKGVDEGLLALHQIFRLLLELRQHDGRGLDLRLTTKQSRRRWEDAFNREVIQPCLKDISNHIRQGLNLVMNDKRLGNDPLMKAVFEVDASDDTGSGGYGYLLPSLWRYRVLVSIDHLGHTLKNSNDFPVLSAFLKHNPHLRALQYLPDIVQLQRSLVDRFSRRIDRAKAKETTISTFLNQLSSHSERRRFEKLIESYNSAWLLSREAIRTRARFRPPPNTYYDEIVPKSRLAFILPTTGGFGHCATALVDFLVMVQNDFISEYRGILGEKLSETPQVSLLNSTHAQLVSYDADRHLLPLVLAHCHYTLEIGQGTRVDYNWASLEKQIEQRFIAGRPLIEMAEIRLVFSEDVHNISDLAALRRRIPQEELSTAVQRQIVGELISLPDVCKVIRALEIAIGFLASSGGSGNMLLSEYIKRVLNMAPVEELISNKLQQSCELRHLLSAWQVLSVERARRLTVSRQDAFEDIDPAFKHELSDELCEALSNALLQIRRDIFLAELFEYISVHLSTRQSANIQNLGEYAINEALGLYLDSKQVVLEGVDLLPYELELQHATAVWTFVAEQGQSMHISQAARSFAYAEERI